MKFFKSAVAVAIASIMLLTLCSCGGIEKKILGSWEWENEGLVSTKYTYTFEEGGKGSYTAIANLKINFTWSVTEDGKISIKTDAAGLQLTNSIYTAEVKGDTLILSNDSTKMTLKKAK